VAIYSPVQNQIGDTTIKIIDHEIKRYVVRVKEFKQKSARLKKLMEAGDKEKVEPFAEELKRDEKKLAVSGGSLTWVEHH
jgi:sulfur transfer protein SufE